MEHILIKAIFDAFVNLNTSTYRHISFCHYTQILNEVSARYATHILS